MTKVFISGSISIKALSNIVKDSIDRIISNNFMILVGDAKGIDTEIQKYCAVNNYFNLKVYSIYYESRNNLSLNFLTQTVNINDDSIKSERERQTFKDIKMTEDCDYGLVIWDEESKGSFENILRLIKLNKPFKVYSSKKNDFLNEFEKEESNIQKVYTSNNGLTASEVVKELQKRNIHYFNNARDINNFLLNERVIYKDKNYYLPSEGYENLVIIKYSRRGTQSKYTLKTVDYLENKLTKERLF